MKARQIITMIVALLMAIISTAPAQAQRFNLKKADLHDRMTYHRAIDAAVWAMPLMNFKF